MKVPELDRQSEALPFTYSKSWSLYNSVYHEGGNITDHVLAKSNAVFMRANK